MSVDRISFDSFCDSGFNLEDAKHKINRLEENVKNQKLKNLRMKIKFKQLESRLNHMDNHLLFPFVNPHGKMEFYDVHCHELNITPIKVQGIFRTCLSIGSSVFGLLYDTLRIETSSQFLKQFDRIETVYIHITMHYCRIHDESSGELGLYLNMLETILQTNANLEIVFTEYIAQVAIGAVVVLLKKYRIKKVTFELVSNYTAAYKLQLDDMKAHCIKHGIGFACKERKQEEFDKFIPPRH